MKNENPEEGKGKGKEREKEKREGEKEKDKARYTLQEKEGDRESTPLDKYNRSSAINQSLLQYIDPKQGGSPAKFKHRWDNPEKSEGKHFQIGSLIHQYILEPDKFAVISSERISQKALSIANFIWEAAKDDLKRGIYDIEGLLSEFYLEELITEYAYQNPLWKMSKRVENLSKEIKPYLEKQLEFSDRLLIDDSTLNTVMQCVASLRRNQSITLWLEKDLFEEYIDVYDEQCIYWEMEISGSKIQLKARLDRLIVNHKKKSYKVIDPKSTGKAIELFHDTLTEYRYDRQMAFYLMAAKAFVTEQLGLEDYVPEEGHLIFAVETFGLYESRSFMIKLPTLKKVEEEIMELLETIMWHVNTNNWEYPKGLEPSGEYQGTYIVELNFPD